MKLLFNLFLERSIATCFNSVHFVYEQCNVHSTYIRYIRWQSIVSVNLLRNLLTMADVSIRECHGYNSESSRYPRHCEHGGDVSRYLEQLINMCILLSGKGTCSLLNSLSCYQLIYYFLVKTFSIRLRIAEPSLKIRSLLLRKINSVYIYMAQNCIKCVFEDKPMKLPISSKNHLVTSTVIIHKGFVNLMLM